MALKKLRMICAGGDKTLAEWDTETVSPERLAEIEKEFNEKIAEGYFAADISEKRDVLIREFDPDAEILLIPRVTGGRMEYSDEAREKARQLLRQVLPKDSLEQMEEYGFVTIQGTKGEYVLSPYNQTVIRNKTSKVTIAHACLQLTAPAPALDKVVAEYLLIKNDENFYWKTANIFRRSGRSFFEYLIIFLLFAMLLMLGRIVILILMR